MTHSSANTELTLAGDYLLALRDFALSKGISARSLLLGSSITLETLLNPPKRISSQVMQELFSNLFFLTDDVYKLAIEFGRFIAMGSHGMLGVAAQSCKTLRDAVVLFSTYIKVRSLANEVELIEDKEGLTIVVRSTDPAVMDNLDQYNEARIFYELMLSSNLELFVITVVAEEDYPSSQPICRLTQADPKNQYLIESFPLGIIEFNHPQMEIFVPNDWLEVTFRHNNEELLKLAADKCAIELEALSPKDFIQEIRDRVKVTKEAIPSIEAMAAQLFMSTSTLQRKLRAQNYTYQQIKQEERQREAEHLLRDTLTQIEDIASQLGFSDGSNFSTSFKSWTGMTPVAYRSGKKKLSDD